jgi:hemerythrin-like domain-containing protein
MSAYDGVVDTIKQEHRVLGHVVEVLQHVLRDIAAEHSEADFNLLAAALYYIDDFPERLHHPKEDEHLFAGLRARSSDFNALLDELQSEHVRSAEMVREMHAALVHYLAGAYGSLQAFRSQVEAYASMLREHMRKEEDLLARACTCLPDSEWRDILAAFEANEDPLLAQDVRTEFRKLHRRIQNLLPRKLRYPRDRERQ